MRRKDKSHRIDREEKKDWIGEEMTRRAYSHHIRQGKD